MLIVTIAEIHTLILDVCMIMQFYASSANLLLNVFQINLETVGSRFIFHVNKIKYETINDMNEISYESLNADDFFIEI